MELSTNLQLQEAQERVNQLTQDLDGNTDPAQRADIENELRQANDQVHALTAEQYAANDLRSTTSSGSTSAERTGELHNAGARDNGDGITVTYVRLDETQRALMESGVAYQEYRTDGGAAAPSHRDRAAEQADAREQAAAKGENAPGYDDRSQSRERDPTDALHRSLRSEPGNEVAPETAAAIEGMEQRGAPAERQESTPEQVRAIRDGESIAGTIEDRVTVDGQDFYTVDVEGPDGKHERVLVPAVDGYDAGDSITANRAGHDVSLSNDYGHGL